MQGLLLSVMVVGVFLAVSALRDYLVRMDVNHGDGFADQQHLPIQAAQAVHRFSPAVQFILFVQFLSVVKSNVCRQVPLNVPPPPAPPAPPPALALPEIVEVEPAEAVAPAETASIDEAIGDGADGGDKDGQESVQGNASEVEMPEGGERNAAADAEVIGAVFDDMDMDGLDDGVERGNGGEAAERDEGAAEGRAAEWDLGGDVPDAADAVLGAAAAGGVRDEEVPLEEFLGLRGPVRHMVRGACGGVWRGRG
jgi:hypothetical protein